MRLLADTNIVSPAVRALRADGHDIAYSAERTSDPGDAALLAEAYATQRVFVSKDHDIGALVFQGGAAHAGVLLIDDLGSTAEELALIRACLVTHGAQLSAGAFVRATARGSRVATT